MRKPIKDLLARPHITFTGKEMFHNFLFSFIENSNYLLILIFDMFSSKDGGSNTGGTHP